MLSRLYKNYQSKDDITNKEIVSNLPQPPDLLQPQSINISIPYSNVQSDSTTDEMTMYPSTFENKPPQQNRSNNKKKNSSTFSQSVMKRVSSSSPTAVKSNRSKASTPAMSNRWSCPMCTYDNNSSRPLRFCDVCGYDRKGSESLTTTPKPISNGKSSLLASSSGDSEQIKCSTAFHDFLGTDARQLLENKNGDYQQSKKAKAEKKLLSNESSGELSRVGKDVGELFVAGRKVSPVAFGADSDGSGVDHGNGKVLHPIESTLSIMISESPVTDQIKQDDSMAVVVSLDEGDDSTEDVAGSKEEDSTSFRNPLTSQERKEKKRKQSHSSSEKNSDDQNSNSHDSVVGDTAISTKFEEDQTVGSPKSQRGVWDEGALKAYPCSRVGANYQAILGEGPVTQDGDKYVTHFSMNGEAVESGQAVDWNKDNDLYEVLWLVPSHERSELIQDDDCVDMVRSDTSIGERLQNVPREQVADNSPTSVSQSETPSMGLVNGSAIVKNDDDPFQVALTAYHAFLCEKKSLTDSESKKMVDNYDIQIDRFLSSYQKTPVTALNALFRCNYSLQKARALMDDYLEQSSPGLSKRVAEEQNPLLSISPPLDLRLTVLNDEERKVFQAAFENFGEAWKDLKIAMGGKYSIMQLKDYFHHAWKHDYRDDYISSKRAYNIRKRVRAAQQRRNPRAKVNASAANEPRWNTSTDITVITSPAQEESNFRLPIVDSIIVERSEEPHGLDSLTERSAVEVMKDNKVLDVKFGEPVENAVTFAS